VTEFIDCVFRENARRALAREAPLDVRQAKERWTDLMEKKAAFSNRTEGKAGGDRGDSFRHDNNRGRGRGRGRGGAVPTRAGTQLKGKGAKLNGDSVCFHYNRAVGCSRTLKGAGCDNGAGGVYAHVCNAETNPGVFCLNKHPKAGNH